MEKIEKDIEEIWLDIPEYKGLYQVSSLGRIKSLARQDFYGSRFFKERLLKPDKNKSGYLLVTLYKNKIKKRKLISQLVAIAFLNHIPCGHEIVVDHINDIKTDNRLNNLQLLSNGDNISKSLKNKTSKYRGVYWAKDRNKWKAEIVINGKKKSLGRFINEEDASKAYLKESKLIIK